MLVVEDSPLYSAEFFAAGDPYTYLNDLRENHPVSVHRRADGYEFYALTRYADVYAAYVDHVGLSSSYGTMIDGSYRPEKDSASGRMLIVADEPAHAQIKKPVKHSGFNREMIGRIGETVRRNIRTALGALSVGDRLDFTTVVAPELPKGVLEVLFGIGPQDALGLLEATRTMIGYRDQAYVGESPLDSLVDAQLNVLDFMDDLISARIRSGSSDDMIGFLAQLVAAGEMSRDVALLNGLNVAVGGNETTPHTASLCVATIDDERAQWRRVVDGQVASGVATQEFLRWTSTNSYVQRLSVRDVEIGGQTIPANSFVTLWNMAANRDPRVFDRPDEFIIDRPDNKQIAFGAGVHRCIGAPVATLEIQMFLEELAAWDKAFRVLAPPQRLHSNFMLGLTELQVEVIKAGEDG
ncbi:cytochrome P450 [Actinoplanes teichomyceticus]|uniref:Cytochrome P450 n=1 Tax=Actinoplanes teichomyceticus TaxID=1867 RepID=A0A561WK51_ACTTI|nr:cytochrome P450 [Actinoplanes teichomyceticus]TWG24200.1 cytochrome P450 [Actinoplanes teichomyceticus]GIF12953.1 cytochrome P450 [Actinoplanes teichomyceticus]